MPTSALRLTATEGLVGVRFLTGIETGELKDVFIRKMSGVLSIYTSGSGVYVELVWSLYDFIECTIVTIS